MKKSSAPVSSARARAPQRRRQGRRFHRLGPPARAVRPRGICAHSRRREKIQGDSKALVVIGIGGSYLGARGVIECLCSPNYNLKKKDTPNVYFIGNGLSSAALREVMELIGDDDFSVNVISKSGTTTEPALAFRVFKQLVERSTARTVPRITSLQPQIRQRAH